MNNMLNYNISSNRPLIPNSNQYYLENKYVSIHSGDRDVLKYPDSSQFEIELPQDYLNVQSVRLYSWSFPSNYNVFSIFRENIFIKFKLDLIYNPAEHGILDPLNEAIYAALNYNIKNDYVVAIETGFYNPDQMATELTNKFNEAITIYLRNFFADPNFPEYHYAADLFKEYKRFIIVYNSVQQKLWFGNTSDKFTITNESNILINSIFSASCFRKQELPDFNTWGLPGYLGFTRCNAGSIKGNYDDSASEIQLDNNNPRFYYGDVLTPGDNGFWLLPDPALPGSNIYFLQAPLKINFMGESYIYMDVAGLNCIDETVPYNVSKFTTETNKTNGIVNSSFAKIGVVSTPISQWFDSDSTPYKYFYPPAERLRKLNIRFRYHNGLNVNFGNFEYSFMLEINLLRPQQDRVYNIKSAFDLS
jgi:hypothetical protein